MKNKKTQTILIVLSLFILIGCSKNKANWINTNIDGNILPEKPSLKDDFYQSVNYDDLKNNPLHSESVVSNGQIEINRILVQHVTSMAKNADKENASDSPHEIEKQKLIALFNMSLDWEKRNKEGVKP
jgi:predicted metalloendopeptidase